MAADYAALAATLAEISRRRAQTMDEDRRSSGQGTPWAQAFYEHMQKVWQDQAGRNIHQNAFGVAPQILDNDKNMQWMQSALQDPRGGGGGYSGGIMHTPDAMQNIEAIKQERARQLQEMQQRQHAMAQDAQRYGWNSNNDMPRNWNSTTGERDTNVSNSPRVPQQSAWGQAPSQWGHAPGGSPGMVDTGIADGTVNALARNPQHASLLADYIARSGARLDGGTGDYMQSGGGYDNG